VSLFWGGWPTLLLAFAVGALIFVGMVLLAIRTYRRKRKDR
jgi:hypothetical protein